MIKFLSLMFNASSNKAVVGGVVAVVVVVVVVVVSGVADTQPCSKDELSQYYHLATLVRKK